MKMLESSGRTVEEAVEAALQEMGANREQVEVEVLEEGTRGFLGILGAREARVRVRIQVKPEEQNRKAREFLEGLLSRMKMDCGLETRFGEDQILHVNLTGSELGALIGRRGQTLEAIQYLVNVVANRGEADYQRILLDAEGYRDRRAEVLERLARRKARQVAETGQRVVLEPMNPWERRIVHLAVREMAEIETYSEGEEPNRRVVITKAPRGG
ncbi:DNA-binding protein [Limnochorda pilosa]|uniref:RNA-binding protein KhpB n=2 Tax=Limnochorda pilosa TaxID=1555112 RepID=A0A0K2SRL6_LIMPI|nr:DNA-binding protein [Limnochorda pilosa]